MFDQIVNAKKILANDTTILTDPTRRLDFVLFVEAYYGNIQGDPNAGNAPRQDPLTRFGICTDAKVKALVRKFLAMYEDFQMYIQRGPTLNSKHESIHKELQAQGFKGSKVERQDAARALALKNYFDVRMFGAVMTTGKTADVHCGAVHGPVQIGMGTSLDPIDVTGVSMTRCVKTKQEGNKGQDNEGVGEMAQRFVTPYGLYRFRGHFNPMRASEFVTSADLEAFWRAMVACWSQARSANSGDLAIRGLYVFSHDSKLGNAHAHKLLERIQVTRNTQTPRAFSDYNVEVDTDNLPQGVEFISLV